MTTYRVGVEISASAASLRSTLQSAAADLRGLGPAARAGTTEVARGLDATEKQAARTVGTFERLRAASAGLFAGVGAAVAVSTGVRLADTYGEVTARLRNAVGETVNLVGAQQRVFAVAQLTRSELGATSALVGTFAKGFRDAGTTAEGSLTKALGLTTSINQAIKVSGASAESAAAGLQQLNQGLGSGVLRGDELNSVIEQTPRLAQALADGLGVPIGRLREMGDAGELTRDKIVAALEGQADRIAAEYARLPPTVSGAFTNLSNALAKYLGEANQATGVTRTLADVITFAADNIESIGTAVGIGAFAALAVGAGRLTGELVRMNQVRQIGRAFEEASSINAVKDAAARAAQASAVLRLAESEAGRQRGLALAIGSTSATRVAEDALTAARQRATVAQVELTAAERLAAGAGLGARIAGWGGSIMAFLGGPFGLLTAGLTALPLLFSAISSPAEASANSTGALVSQLRAINDERERAALIQQAGSAAALAEQQLLAQRAQQLERIGELEQRVTELRQGYGVSRLLGAQEAQNELEQERAALVEIDQQLGRNLVATNEYAAAAVTGFQRAAQTGMGVVSVIDLIAEGYTRMTGRAAGADFGAQFAALQKELSGALESSQRAVLQLQGKIPLVEEFRELAAQAKAAGTTVPPELQRIADALLASEAAERRLTTARQAARKPSEEQLEWLRRTNAGFSESARIIGEYVEVNDLLDGVIARTTRAVSARSAVEAEARATLEELAKLRGDERVDQEELARAIALVTQARDRELATLDRRADIGGRLLQQLDEEVRLSGLSAREREVEERLLRATEAGYRGNTDALRSDIAVRLDQIEVNREMQAQAEAYRSAWSSAVGSVTDAFGEFVTGGIKSFGDFKDQIGNIARRLMSDLISQFARRIILNLGVNAQGGGGFLSSLFGGGSSGGGGLLSGLGSLFGGSGASGGGLLGGLGSLFGSFGTTGIAGNVGAGLPFGLGSVANAGFRIGAAPSAGLGSALGAAGGLYGVYQAYRSGSPLSGALSGAMAGSAILPGIGTIIGGIVGALAGVFGGSKPPDIRVGAQGQTRKPEQTFTTALGTLTLGARGLEGGEDAFIPQIQKFDETMLAIVSSFKDGTSQLEAVRGRLATWSVDLKGDAATAENVIGSRFDAILSTFSSAVQSYVGTSGELAERTQRLADAGFLEAAAASGDLLGSFDGLVDVLGDVKLTGESVTDTYGRVLAGFDLLSTALDFVGVSIAGTQEQMVRFSEAFVTAAGGLERAQGLWDAFYNEFYTAEERAAVALERAQATRAQELADIGLNAGISNDEFRRQFLAALPTLSPEQVAQWLEAGAAIQAANAAQRQYNETLGETATSSEAARAALTGVLADVDAFESGLAGAFERLRREGLSMLQQELLQVDDELQANVASLLQMRTAAVAAGASAAELARIDSLLGRAHMLAAEQAAAAITRVRSASRALVDQLYGEDAASAAQEFANQGVEAFGQIGEAASTAYESQLNALRSIQQWLDAQRLGELSSLTPAERYAEAQRQFAATLAAAQGGDADALGRVTGLADALLREGRGMFASGAEYSSLEAAVRAALQGLVGAGGGTAAGAVTPVTGPGTAFGGVIQGAVGEFGQQAATNRLELATQLQAHVADLIAATREPLSVVAQSIGLNVGRLVTDLGVNLNSLTGETGAQLGVIAGSLGIELSELASNVGIELGALADEQSLLNDALEAEIARLPDGQREQLQPLLDAVEAAADDPEGLRAATAALEAEIQAIGGSTRLALAPFFDDIDPTDPLADVSDVLRQGFDSAEGLLGRIAAAVEALIRPAELQPEGSFAAGTGFVPRDMLAQIHQGEAVIDATTMASLRRYGLPVAGTGVSDAVAIAIADLGTRLESRLTAVEAAVRSGAALTATAVTESVGELATAQDMQRRRTL